jgi:hypothetical protein
MVWVATTTLAARRPGTYHDGFRKAQTCCSQTLQHTGWGIQPSHLFALSGNGCTAHRNVHSTMRCSLYCYSCPAEGNPDPSRKPSYIAGVTVPSQRAADKPHTSDDERALPLNVGT